MAMMGTTAAIEMLCAELGVEPVWAKLNQAPPSTLALHLVTYAASLCAAVNIGAMQEQNIAALLDGEAEDMPLEAETYAGLVLQFAEQRNATVDATRKMLGALLEAGLVR
jgi:hypothetical protein